MQLNAGWHIAKNDDDDEEEDEAEVADRMWHAG